MGENNWKKGEDIQLEMGRRVLRVSKMTTKEVIQGELGLKKLSSRRELLRLCYWNKLVKMKDKEESKNRLLYRMYKVRREEFMRNVRKNDKKNWCYWIWKSLKELDLEEIWETERVDHNFKKTIVEARKRREEQEWREQMTKKPKLRRYITLKTKLELEEYVLRFEKRNRRQLTMMRGGTNYLRIERGRWEKETKEERVCNVCVSQEIEDEKHFLLNCPNYKQERASMYEKIRQEFPDLDQIENKDKEWQMRVILGADTIHTNDQNNNTHNTHNNNHVHNKNNNRHNKDIKDNQNIRIFKIVVDYIRKANEIRKRYIK